jgi:hypothetical protein
MNVRHVTRVTRPASRQRAQTNAVNSLPVRSLVQRCSTTAVEMTRSRSRHTLRAKEQAISDPDDKGRTAEI